MLNKDNGHYHHLVNILNVVLILTTVLQAKLDRYLHFIKKTVERYNNSPQVPARTSRAGT